MRAAVAFTIVLSLSACRPRNTFYLDPATGYSVSSQYRYTRGIGVDASGMMGSDGDRGEPGELNASVIEHIFAAREGPFVRYYDLVLALADRPPVVAADLASLDAAVRAEIAVGASPSGRDYARGLGHKLASAINDALRTGDNQFRGTACVHWGIPIDLRAGIVLAPYERHGESENHITFVRYASVGLIVMHTSVRLPTLVWDLSEVPGAFAWNAQLDPATVAARIVALHPTEDIEQ